MFNGFDARSFSLFKLPISWVFYVLVAMKFAGPLLSVMDHRSFWRNLLHACVGFDSPLLCFF